MRKALVAGGGNGIGLSIVYRLIEMGYDKVIVIDRDGEHLPQNQAVEFVRCNFLAGDFSVFEAYLDVDALFVTAGFGRLAFFQYLEEQELINGITVNEISAIRIVRKFYPRLMEKRDFYCGIMGSIAGHINSPLFSVYSAAKAGLCRFIECVNAELAYLGSPNRILDASPGNIKGTRFDGAAETDLGKVRDFAAEFLERTFRRELLYIPDYDKVYRDVLERNARDSHAFGLESIEYKKRSGRLENPSLPQLATGYLSGTFDLFHIGHLNILRRAKQFCDYLVVGVHRDASHKGKETFIPFEERKAILEGIRYVDRVIQACPEDMDVYRKGIVKYRYLFVGSDYQGTERFRRYEEYFSDKDVEIVYFPYTKGTSSTQLREALEGKG